MTVRAVQHLLSGALQTPSLGYQGTLGAFDSTHWALRQSSNASSDAI
jgi:hypothetical protein